MLNGDHPRRRERCEDAWRLRGAGTDAVLVGEAAMRDPALVTKLCALQMALKTSDTHPIRVDFVNAEKLTLPGRIGLTFAPGKKQRDALSSGHWDRDLDEDLARLRAYWHTDLLVSLIEEHEFATLQIPTLREQAQVYGIDLIWFPIRDMSVPTSMEEFVEIVGVINSGLRKGRIVVIHCMGGLGRTGLVAAASLLVATKLTPKEAIAVVRSARRGTIQTREQEEYIDTFHKFINRQQADERRK